MKIKHIVSQNKISENAELQKQETVSEGSVHGYNVMKVNAKHDQLKITAWLRKQLGLPKDAPLYFDDADLVWGDNTIVPDALVNPKLKMNDLLTATVKATGQGQAVSDQGGYYREAGVAEDGETIGTIGSVQGDQITIKNADGSETKTTAAAVLPGPDGKTATMSPSAAGGLKPGTPVTAESTKDTDTIKSGNKDVGGDPTDNLINQVRDKKFEKSVAKRSTLPEGDELMKWLTIAGLK